MADYNIYIHSYGQYDSPTTPTQLRANSDTSGVGGEGGAGGSGFGELRRAASFVQNPDSLISKATNFLTTPAGKVGMVAFAIKSLVDIGKKTINLYQQFHAPNSGDFAFINKYNNFNRTLDAFMHPFSTSVSVLQGMFEERRKNSINEQERLLTGGSILNNKYGRYL